MSARPRPFQQATIDAAVAALGAGSGTRRFLVADEVGLGKTLVAREVIHGLHRAAGSKSLRVFYVSSGRRVADQNKSRLLEFLDKPAAQEALSPIDRIGLIPIESGPSGPRRGGVRLYAFTPATSFPPSGARLHGGRALERALVKRLLRRCYPDWPRYRNRELFQGRAGDAGWAQAQAEAKRRSASIGAPFLAAYRRALRIEFEGTLAQALSRRRTESVTRIMGRLRRALAHASLLAWPPDLIVFDEFQSYRKLFFDDDQDAIQGATLATTRGAPQDHPLVRALLEGAAESGRRAPALLLLSATPYRVFAEHWQESEGAKPHRQLFKLIDFLGGAGLAKRSEDLFERFGHLLYEFAHHPGEDSAQLQSIEREAASVRDRLQAGLCRVMSRTERGGGGHDHANTLPLATGLELQDLRAYRHFVLSRKQALRGQALPYWMSVPLPAQALGSNQYRMGEPGPRVAGPRPLALHRNKPYRHADGDWGSPKLRALRKIAPSSSLALPWNRPSLPWWPLDPDWNAAPSPKLLLFSRFRATPQSVAALLSLGVERERLGAQTAYPKAWKTRQLQAKAGRGPVLNLFHPSPWLIRVADPLRATATASPRTALRTQLLQALRELDIGTRPRLKKDRARHRPAWKVLAAIERRAGWFAAAQSAWQPLGRLDAPLKELLLERERASQQDLPWISPAELNDLVELALSGPAVVLGRALRRHHPGALDGAALTELVGLCWLKLRRYLDKPVFLARRSGTTAVAAIQQAVFGGGLEAVLDEHFWLGKTRTAADKLLGELGEALQAGLGSFTFRALDDESASIQLRCHAALPFGGTESESSGAAGGDEDGPPRSEQIRQSFNTPFWPHVLATTSVGQEGLDFHSWCDRIAHWDLCSNPVDLEQREGRIQRYAGLAIRRALARQVGEQALRQARAEGVSPWERIATLADTLSDASGLRPWWRLPDANIQRYVFALPQGRDRLRFERLREQRLLYRLALGQPNQEDLLARLSQQSDARIHTLSRLALNLSAFQAAQTPVPPPAGIAGEPADAAAEAVPA